MEFNETNQYSPLSVGDMGFQLFAVEKKGYLKTFELVTNSRFFEGGGSSHLHSYMKNSEA